MAISCPVFLLVSFFAIATAKRSTGVLETSEDWDYLDRFCFRYDGSGNLLFNLQFPANFSDQKLYLYYDDPTQWPAVYGTDLTCAEKETITTNGFNQILILNSENVDQNGEHMCQPIMRGDESWLRCEGNRRFASRHDRWWFLALGNCNSSQGLYVEYDLTFTNDDSQFSEDESYVLPVDIGFLVAEIAVLIGGVSVSRMRRLQSHFHQTSKLFLTSVLLECTNLLLGCAAYGRYARDGIEMPMIKLFSQIFRAAAVVALVFLLILTAKGPTITRNCVSKISNLIFSALASCFILTYGALFFWQTGLTDPGVVTHLYQSWPAYILFGLRIVALLWFCMVNVVTQFRHEEKRSFYLAFSIVFILWFCVGAINIIIAKSILNDWEREKIVNVVENAIALYGFGAFLLFTRLSTTTARYSASAETTQIGGILHDKALPIPQLMTSGKECKKEFTL